MKQTLYHGSFVKGLVDLKPQWKNNNTLKKPVVYFTTNDKWKNSVKKSISQ